MSFSSYEHVDASNTAGASTTYEDEEASAIWEERYEELVHFQRGHGHCRVPVDSRGGGALGKWVMHLREKYKRFTREGRYRGQLTQERIERLNALNFEWSLRPPNTPWEERFQQLHEFWVEHGHTRVKRSHGNNNNNKEAAFGEWVQKQRKLFRANKLSNERMQKLRSVNFEERLVATPNKTWDESFQLLLEFRRQHGHARVPKPVKGMAPGDDHSLRVWADRQRSYYHTCVLQKKPNSTLTKKRVKQLNDVGFDWGTYRGQQTIWNRRLQQLKEYREQNGDTNVPFDYEPNKALGRWVSEQRALYNKTLAGKQSSLTLERRVALQSTGFQWKKPKKKNGTNKKKTMDVVTTGTAAAVSSASLLSKSNAVSTSGTSTTNLHVSLDITSASATTDSDVAALATSSGTSVSI